MHALRRFLSIVIAVTLAACSPSTPSGTVDAFYHFVEAGKYDQAFACFSAQTRAVFPAEKVKAILVEQSKKQKAGGGLKSIAFSDEKVTGEAASITAATTLKNGETTSENINLVREDGKWLIVVKK